MPAVKISSKVDEKVWSDLRALANETHQNVSGLLTEAIQEYVACRRVRPLVLKHLEKSMDENEEIGEAPCGIKRCSTSRSTRFVLSMTLSSSGSEISRFP